MKISWIDDGELAAGGIPISAENFESLKEQGIQAIVTLTEHNLPDQTKSTVADNLKVMNFDLLHVSVVDQTPPTREQAQAVLNFVVQKKSEGKPVYLHCHAGVGRTGTMLHAIYLLSGMSLEDVKAKIKAERPASQFFMLTDVQKAFIEKLAEEITSD